MCLIPHGLLNPSYVQSIALGDREDSARSSKTFLEKWIVQKAPQASAPLTPARGRRDPRRQGRRLQDAGATVLSQGGV